MTDITPEEYHRIVPKKYRDKIKIEAIKRIHPDDPEWECGKVFYKQHVCVEFHNATGSTTHKCCCGIQWEDD